MTHYINCRKTDKTSKCSVTIPCSVGFASTQGHLDQVYLLLKRSLVQVNSHTEPLHRTTALCGCFYASTAVTLCGQLQASMLRPAALARALSNNLFKFSFSAHSYIRLSQLIRAHFSHSIIAAIRNIGIYFIAV